MRMDDVRSQRLMLLVSACAVVFVLTLASPAWLIDAEERLRDRLIAAQAVMLVEDRLVVVDIDEASLAALGPWPWPRARLADLVEILLAQGARAVALDILLPEAADAEGDARLASLAAHGPLALPVAFDFVPRQPPLAVGELAGGTAPTGAPAVWANGYLANHAGLSGARCVGNIGFVPDPDGVLRRIPAAVEFAGRRWPTLAEALLACAAGIAVSPQPTTFASAYWRLVWRDPASYTVVSAADLLAEPPDLEAAALVRGRFVLVGASALGLADRVAIPLAAAVPGIMVHAQAVSQLLDAAAGRAPTLWPGTLLALAWCLLLGLLAWLAVPRLPAWGAALALVAPALLWLPLAGVISATGVEFPFLAPPLAALVLLLVALPFEWHLAQRQERSLRELFGHYVAPAVLAEILRRPAGETLAPAHRDIAVLVADMQDYTHYTARLPLERAAELTRSFLDLITAPVLAAGGTLDKYTGDGLVAFWGAPLPSNDATAQALAAARAMLAAVAEFNRRAARADFPPLVVRIGIESGPALVGDLGTPFRSAYTAVGDCINFAAKLQEAARDLPVPLLVGPVAAARLTGAGLVPAGERRLGGRSVVCWTLPV